MSSGWARVRAVSVCVGLGLWLAGLPCAPASGYVTIGPNHDPDPMSAQAVNQTSPSVVLNVDAPPGIRVLSPISGVVTRWSIYTGDVSAGATLQLRVMAPEGGAKYKMSGSGPVEVLAASSGQANLNTFVAHVPILAGQTVGAGLSHPNGGFLEITLPQTQPAPSAWAYGILSPPPQDGFSGTATITDSPGPGADLFVVLSADVEPDADGYGDDTQDLCPSDPAKQAACPTQEPPPDTSRPTVRLSGVPSSMSMGAFLKGVRATLRPGEPVALEAELFGTINRAQVSAFNLRLASKSLKLAAGRRTLRLKPRRSLVGRPGKRFKVRLRIRAIDAARNATVLTKTITVRPRGG